MHPGTSKPSMPEVLPNNLHLPAGIHRILKALLILVVPVLLCPNELWAQDTLPVNAPHNRRLGLVIATGSVAYAGSIAGLYSLWYKDYPQSSFHFFNDNREWMGMDKAGHTLTSYYLGRMGYEVLKWSGIGKKSAVWYGGLTGLAYLTTIEIFDGFSAQWGASPGDVAANVSGAILFIGQQLIWNDQKILLKISYLPTDYPDYNPALLGNNSIQRMIKDYNGQTYWFSANISSFLKDESGFPKWLNLAAGYGADGMTGAYKNPESVNGTPIPYFERKRQFYLAPDVDFTRIHTRSEWLQWLLKGISFIKIPAPALEFSRNKVRIHALYF